MKNTYIIGVDFDGTIIPKLPIGSCDYDTGAESVLKDLVAQGHMIVLFTCRNKSKSNPYNYISGVRREEDSLDEALRWFRERNIPLSGINKSPGQVEMVGASIKPHFHIVIDDTNLGTKLKEVVVCIPGHHDSYKTYCVDWDWVRQELIKIGAL